MLKLGNKTIGNACLGDKQLSAVFLGDKLIWSAGITLKATDLGKYGIVDLGDLVWSYQSGHQRFTSGTLASVIKPCDAGVIPNLYAEGFVAEKLNNMSVGGTDKSISVYTNSYVFAKDAGYTDATLFRNSLKGQYLIYELATPTSDKLSDLTAVQLYNLLTLNGTDFTNLEKLADGYAVKCGEFKIENNTIKGTRYGIVDLGTLTWQVLNYADEDARFYAYDIKDIVKKPLNDGTLPAVYSFIFEPSTVNKAWGASYNKNSICIGSDGFIGIRSNGNNYNVTDFKTSLNGVYLIFELATPLGSKLDNYTAEQAYNLLIGTAPSTKLPYPNGIKFEMNGNAIKGTKYGLVDLGTMNFGSVASDNPIRTASTTFKGIIKGVAWATEITNSYIAGFEAKTGSQAYGTNNAKSFGVDSVGTFYLTDPAINGFNYSQVQAYLKGKYLIFELATPDGSDYSDLTAKQMFDLINTDKLGVLANGKSFDGNRSLLGNETNIVKGSNQWYFTKGACFDTTKSGYGVAIKNAHKYFAFSDITTTETLSYVSLRNSSFSGLGSSADQYQANGVACATITATTDGTLHAIGFHGITPTNSNATETILLDLTELGLNNLTAQEVYQHFKEYDLDKLKTDNIIKIGGFVK